MINVSYEGEMFYCLSNQSDLDFYMTDNETKKKSHIFIFKNILFSQDHDIINTAT